jgi:hypothetical protein
MSTVRELTCERCGASRNDGGLSAEAVGDVVRHVASSGALDTINWLHRSTGVNLRAPKQLCSI